jgi:hypothetical protein
VPSQQVLSLLPLFVSSQTILLNDFYGIASGDADSGKQNKKKMKTYTLEEVTNKHIGEIGTPKRDAFENELRIELLGHTIKKARNENKTSQLPKS